MELTQVLPWVVLGCHPACPQVTFEEPSVPSLHKHGVVRMNLCWSVAIVFTRWKEHRLFIPPLLLRLTCSLCYLQQMHAAFSVP